MIDHDSDCYKSLKEINDDLIKSHEHGDKRSSMPVLFGRRNEQGYTEAIARDLVINHGADEAFISNHRVKTLGSRVQLTLVWHGSPVASEPNKSRFAEVEFNVYFDGARGKVKQTKIYEETT